MKEVRFRMSLGDYLCETNTIETSDEDSRNFHIELIQKYVGNIDQLPNSSEWKKIVLKAKVEILKEFAVAIQQFYTVSQLRFL